MANPKSKPIARAFDTTSLILFGIFASSLLLFTIWIAKENFNLDAQSPGLSKSLARIGEINQQVMAMLFNFLTFLIPAILGLSPLYFIGRVTANKIDRCIEDGNAAPINEAQQDTQSAVAEQKGSTTKSLMTAMHAMPGLLKRNPTNIAIVGLALGTGLLFAVFGGKTAYSCHDLFLAAQSESFNAKFRKLLGLILEISQPIGFGFIGMITGFTTGFTAKAIGNTLRTAYAKMTGKELEPHIFNKIMDHLKLYKREELVIGAASIFVGLLYAAICSYIAYYAFDLEKLASLDCLGRKEEEKRAINAGLQAASGVVVPSIMATAGTFALLKSGLGLFHKMPCGKSSEEEQTLLGANTRKN